MAATKADLLKAAKKAGVEADESMTKEQIQAAIDAAAEGGDDGDVDGDADQKTASDSAARPATAKLLSGALSNDKRVRAIDVVQGRRSFDADGVEQRALKLCKSEGAKTEDELCTCVYRKLGGAFAGDDRATDDRVGEINVKKSGKENESLPDPA